MKTLVSAGEMKAFDAMAAGKLEGGTRTLMGRAGQKLYEAFLAVKGEIPDTQNIAVISGGGGNGGDGYALAEQLKKHGYHCRVFMTTHKKSADGEYYYERAESAGAEFEMCCEHDEYPELSVYGVIFDCVFGVGFHGAPREREKQIIERINSSGAYVISADINSGLDADSGLFECAVRSDLTVAIGIYKYGHFLGSARDLIRKLCLADIGISSNGEGVLCPDDGDFLDIFTPRLHNSHKGTYGTSVIMGGCREYSGAVKLANLSMTALRMGVGISRLAVPESIVGSVSPYLLESTLFPMPDRDGHAIYSPDTVNAALSKASSVAVGMGWGQSEDNIKIITDIIAREDLRVIIDADGLNAVAAAGAGILKDARAHVLITPHPAEFSRLSGTSVSEILSSPVRSASAFAQKYGVTVLLKGTGTVITDGRETYIVNRGSAGMAAAGSGDVLSGALAGLLAYNELTPKSVAAAAYVCGLAGEEASREIGDISMTSGDTAKHIASAVKYLSSVTTE